MVLLTFVWKRFQDRNFHGVVVGLYEQSIESWVGLVILQTNASTNADFLNYIGQQARKNHLCRDDWTFELNYCNFTFKISDKTTFAGGLFYRNGCPMPVLLMTRAPVYMVTGGE